MSRIGVVPIAVPAGADVTVDNDTVTLRGSKGEATVRVLPGTTVTTDDHGQLAVSRTSDELESRERHGLMRTLLANALHGVTEGFARSLEINGVGFKAQVSGNTVILNIGFSHPQEVTLPEGVTAHVDGNVLTVSGIDKQLVGQVAADIRSLRPPEPYKGKGIAYTDERVRRKAGKTAGAGK